MPKALEPPNAVELPNGLDPTGDAGHSGHSRHSRAAELRHFVHQRHLNQGCVANAADQGAGGSDVDEAPRAVVLVHRIFIGFAHVADAAGGFDQVVDFGGIAAELGDVAANAALVLVAAPDHLLLALALALGFDFQGGRSERNQHHGYQKNGEQQGVALLT